MQRIRLTVLAVGFVAGCGDAVPPAGDVPAASERTAARYSAPSAAESAAAPQVPPIIVTGPPAAAAPPSRVPVQVEPDLPRPAVDSPPRAGAARPAQPEPLQDEGARVLRRAEQAYAPVRAMQAEFVLHTQNPLTRAGRTSSGTLFQKSPDRLLLRFRDPAGDIVMSDGTRFWAYYPSVDSVQVNCSRAENTAGGGVDLRAQFVGNPVEKFRYTHEGRETIDGRATDVLTLVPRADSAYERLKVWVDAQDALVRQFEIVEASGTTRRFQLSDLLLNPSLSDDLFRFTPPPGTQVIGCT